VIEFNIKPEAEWRRRVDRLNAAIPLCLEIEAKIRYLPYDADITIMPDWMNSAIRIWINDHSLPVDYVCGIVSEFEELLGLDEAVLEAQPDRGLLLYRSKYKGHQLVIYHIPKDTCVFVETGEEEVYPETRTKLKKLVCS